MKNTITPLLFFVFILAFLFLGCRSGDLSRSEGKKLIEASREFKQPFALELMQGETLLPYGKTMDVQESGEETPEQLSARKIREYYEKKPQIAAANYLGVVKARVKTLDTSQPKQHSRQKPQWSFEEEYLATEKTKTSWKHYDLPPTATSLPLAGKEIVEIPGAEKQGEDRAAAQFTWKFAPNGVGKTFNTFTAEFKSLPSELQRLLDGTLPPDAIVSRRKTKTVSFAGARPGEALLRRYDDGWRLEGVLFQ